MYAYPKFPVEVVREVATDRLGWPAPGQAIEGAHLCLNHEYIDLRGLTWREARLVLQVEAELIFRIEASGIIEPNISATGEEGGWDEPPEAAETMFGLDAGVASSVVALSAARCVPVSSCNGGAFGGLHHEAHPLVAFFTRPEAVPLLLDCARAAGAGLVCQDSGNLCLYADDVRAMPLFAKAVADQSRRFRALGSHRMAREGSTATFPVLRQPGLFD